MKYKNIIFTISLFTTTILISVFAVFYLDVASNELIEQICFSIVGSCVFTIPSFIVLLFNDYISKRRLIDSVFYDIFLLLNNYDSISNPTLYELNTFCSELRVYNYRVCEIQEKYMISKRYKCDDVTKNLRDLLLICNHRFNAMSTCSTSCDNSIDQEFCRKKSLICTVISDVLKLKHCESDEMSD